jgi:hypothetical protein
LDLAFGGVDTTTSLSPYVRGCVSYPAAGNAPGRAEIRGGLSGWAIINGSPGGPGQMTSPTDTGGRVELARKHVVGLFAYFALRSPTGEVSYGSLATFGCPAWGPRPDLLRKPFPVALGVVTYRGLTISSFYVCGTARLARTQPFAYALHVQFASRCYQGPNVRLGRLDPTIPGCAQVTIVAPKAPEDDSGVFWANPHTQPTWTAWQGWTTRLRTRLVGLTSTSETWRLPHLPFAAHVSAAQVAALQHAGLIRWAAPAGALFSVFVGQSAAPLAAPFAAAADISLPKFGGFETRLTAAQFNQLALIADTVTPASLAIWSAISLVPGTDAAAEVAKLGAEAGIQAQDVFRSATSPSFIADINGPQFERLQADPAVDGFEPLGFAGPVAVRADNDPSPLPPPPITLPAPGLAKMSCYR